MAEFILVKSKKHNNSRLYINLNHVEQIFVKMDDEKGGVGVMINGEMFVFDTEEMGGHDRIHKLQMYLDERIFSNGR